MAYTYDSLFAVDPNFPSNVARNASILLFDPDDATKTAVTLTDVTDSPITNPLTTNQHGFGPAFKHATLDRLAWEGAGMSGVFTSYEGLKAEAVAARAAAETAAADAAAAAEAELTARIAAGEFVGEKGADGSNVLPTDTAIKNAITTPGTETATALNATILDQVEAPIAAALEPVKSLGWAQVPPSLYALDAALAKSDKAPAVIIGLGDSLWEGLSAAVYAESIPGRAAGAFRGRYGIAGGGAGFIPAAWPLEGDPTAPQDMIPAYTGTVTKATGATAALGPGRKSLQMSAAATATFKPVVCTGFDIIHAKSISSNQSFTYAVDAGSAVSVSLSAERVTLTAATAVGATVLPVSSVPADWYPGVQLSVEASGSVEPAYVASISGLNVTLKTALTLAHNSGVPVAAHSNGGYTTPVRGLARAAHTVKLTAVTTTTIEGIRYYDGDEAVGVHWINAGHGGIRADQLKLTGNTDHSMKAWAAMKPAAIFCNLGINDSGVQTPSQFTANLTTLKADALAAVAARGYPKPSWVQVIPYEPETLTGRYQGTKWSEYVEAVHAWAKADTTGPGGTSGVHVIDLGRRMPGSRSDATLFNADLLHPTSEGSRVFVDWMVSALPISQ